MQKVTQETDKKDLIIAGLKERIGVLAATYESEIVFMRAEYTELKNVYDKLVLELEEAQKKSLYGKESSV